VSKWPIFVRGLVITICSIILAIGGCLGALSNGDKPLGLLGALGFIVGVLGFLAGAIMVVIGVFKGLFSLFAPPQE
jgi:hypothetical protein